MYTAYVLDEKTRNSLLEAFPPKYEKVIAHHVTMKFGVPAGTNPPDEADLRVVGYVDSGDGLEALVVSVNGSTQREDGKYYHVTWSLDPAAYKPVDSNELLRSRRYTLILPIDMEATAEVIK